MTSWEKVNPSKIIFACVLIYSCMQIVCNLSDCLLFVPLLLLLFTLYIINLANKIVYAAGLSRCPNSRPFGDSNGLSTIVDEFRPMRLLNHL